VRSAGYQNFHIISRAFAFEDERLIAAIVLQAQQQGNAGASQK
jgi:hypothetical protein